MIGRTGYLTPPEPFVRVKAISPYLSALLLHPGSPLPHSIHSRPKQTCSSFAVLVNYLYAEQASSSTVPCAILAQIEDDLTHTLEVNVKT